jgi:hypothetical protein
MYACLEELDDFECECMCGGPPSVDDPDYFDDCEEDYHCAKCYSTGILELSEYSTIPIIEYVFDQKLWLLKEKGII